MNNIISEIQYTPVFEIIGLARKNLAIPGLLWILGLVLMILIKSNAPSTAGIESIIDERTEYIYKFMPPSKFSFGNRDYELWGKAREIVLDSQIATENSSKTLRQALKEIKQEVYAYNDYATSMFMLCFFGGIAVLFIKFTQDQQYTYTFFKNLFFCLSIKKAEIITMAAKQSEEIKNDLLYKSKVYGSYDLTKYASDFSIKAGLDSSVIEKIVNTKMKHTWLELIENSIAMLVFSRLYYYPSIGCRSDIQLVKQTVREVVYMQSTHCNARAIDDSFADSGSEKFRNDGETTTGQTESYTFTNSNCNDHYQILGLTPDSTPLEIQRAYFTKLKGLHPDEIAKMRPELRKMAMQELEKVKEAFRSIRAKRGF